MQILMFDTSADWPKIQTLILYCTVNIQVNVLPNIRIFRPFTSGSVIVRVHVHVHAYIIRKWREYRTHYMPHIRYFQKVTCQEFKHWPMRVHHSNRILIMAVASSINECKHDSDWKRLQIAIQNEHSWRIYHKTHENTSIFHNLEKNSALA